MKEVEVSEKSLEEAITKASIELGLSSDKIDYMVIEEGKKGLFGLGGKPFIIKAWEKGSKPEVQTAESYSLKSEGESAPNLTDLEVEDYKARTTSFLEELVKKMGEELDVNTDYVDGIIVVKIVGHGSGNLIGKKGQTLDAIEYLANLAVNNNTNKAHVRVRIDIDDYRKRRQETLENLANNMARKAVRTKRWVKLSPMKANERRIIHTTLQTNDDVTTKSEGKEPRRRVVITPNNR